MGNQGKGFTLVELVIVLVILALLAVAAAPKFVDVGQQSHQARVEAVATALQQSVRFAHIQWQVNGQQDVLDLVGFAGDLLDMNDLGYPIGVNKGTGNRWQIGRGNGGCVQLWQNLLDDAPSVATNANNEYQSYRHAPQGGNQVAGPRPNDRTQCSFVYRGSGDTRGRTSAEWVIRYDSIDGSVVLL